MTDNLKAIHLTAALVGQTLPGSDPNGLNTRWDAVRHVETTIGTVDLLRPSHDTLEALIQCLDNFNQDRAMTVQLKQEYLSEHRNLQSNSR